jgi:hypothetical protein
MEKSPLDEELLQLPDPKPFPGANTRLVLGVGAPMQPLKRLAGFSPDEFEIFVLEWVQGYLKSQYREIRRQGGAGDKGRDVVAFIDDSTTKPRRWDNYQCKHYKDPLEPTKFYSELGKLCYYTFKGDYIIPQNYLIVTHQGVGQKLSDFLDKPEELRTNLVKNWENYCETKITDKEKIKLEGDFLEYVKKFDFSIIRQMPPLDLIEQHSKTKYHALIFGTELKKRPKSILPPDNIEPREIRYIEQMYEAFSEHLRTVVNSQEDFRNKRHLQHCFGKAREGFYCAESLKEFARDSYEENYFSEILDEFNEGLDLTVNGNFPDGYERIIKTSEMALQLQISGTMLRDELKPNDRIGMCHHLANEDRISWVIK